MAHLVPLLGALLAAAAPVHTFEQTLGHIRGQVLSTRRAQVESQLRRDIANAAWSARSAARQARSLRWSVADIARRCRAAAPPYPDDPLLRSAVQRAVWDLRDYARRLEVLEAQAASIASRAAKDPEALEAAEYFVFDSRGLRSDAYWLSTDARFAMWDIRRAGFVFEAMDIERAGADGYRHAQRIEGFAGETLEKIR